MLVLVLEIQCLHQVNSSIHAVNRVRPSLFVLSIRNLGYIDTAILFRIKIFIPKFNFAHDVVWMSFLNFSMRTVTTLWLVLSVSYWQKFNCVNNMKRGHEIFVRVSRFQIRTENSETETCDFSRATTSYSTKAVISHFMHNSALPYVHNSYKTYVECYVPVLMDFKYTVC